MEGNQGVGISRVLVIEDNESQRKTLSAVLRDEGFEVHGCTTANEAMVQFGRSRFDVAIVDLGLPDIADTALLERLTEVANTVPLIVYTGRGSYQSAQKAVNVGVFAYVEKGGDLGELIGHVHRASLARVRRYAETLEEAVAERTRQLLDANRALVQSELRQSRVIQASNDGIWEWRDVSRDEFWWSERFYEMLGYEGGEFTPTHERFTELLHPDDRERVQSEIKGRFEQHGPFETEYRLRAKSGTYVWVQARGQTFRDEAGRPVCMCGTVRDLTERRQAEEALKQSEARYRGIVEDQTEYVMRVLPDGTTAFVNGAICRLVGKSPEELRGKPFADFVHPDDLAMVRERLALIVPESPLVTCENRNVLPTGDVRFGEWANRGIFDDDGKLIEIQAVGRDVTKRRRAEEAAVEARTRLELALRSSNVGLWDWDFVSGDVFFSPEWKGQIGYRDDEISDCFEEWKSRLHPDDAEATLPALRDYIDGKAPDYSVEFRFRHKDGSYRWIMTKGEAIPDRDGKPARMLGCHVDITERKRAEEERDRILSLSQDLICIAGMDGYFKYVSPAWKRVLGYSAQELLSRPFLEFIHPDDHARSDAEVARLSQGLATVDFENRYVCKDGSIRSFLWSATPVVGEGIMYCIGRDVTERKRAEAAVAQSERELRTVYDNAPTMMVLVDEDRRIRRANRAATRAGGEQDCHDMIGLRGGEALRCVHALDDSRGCGFGPACQACGLRAMVLDTLRTGAGHYREEHSLRVEREGHAMEIYMLGSSARLTIEDRPHVLLSIEDITQQKEAERVLRERETQLANMSRLHTIGEMAGTLAHELNQPLYAISNYVNGARRRLAKRGPSMDLEPLVEVMERVSKEVDRAAGIISHLRAFVRERETRRSSVDLAQLLKQAADLLGPVARDRGVALQFDVSGDLPVVQADPIQVEQVVVNLVANAIDAVTQLPSERRRVLIVARRAETDGVEVAVQDLGPGIPEGLEDRLFEAFVTTKDEGLGMGLAISRSIVQGHDGRIWAAPNQPHGAAFHFTLPASTTSRE